MELLQLPETRSRTATGMVLLLTLQCYVGGGAQVHSSKTPNWLESPSYFWCKKHRQTGRFRPVCLLIQYRRYTFDRDKAGKKSKRSTPWSLTAPDKVQKHPEPLVKLENPGIARYLWNAHIFWSYQSLIRVCCRVSSFDHGLDFPAIFLSAPIRGKSGSHEKAGWSQ